MAQVPWEVNRDRVEDAVAVMLLREHGDRHAQHRRGDGGDGGIDVYLPVGIEDGKPVIDDYQIKRFTDPLGPTQWKQIRKSLIRARDNDQVRMRTWYLTMPLNPTAGDEKKLAEEAEKLNVPFPCVWKGRSYLNGLASKHPSVIDTLFRDGQERMARDRQQLYALLDLQKRATEPITPHDLIGLDRTLKDLTLGLNMSDPYYSYEVRLGKRVPLDVPPGLYMRQVIGGDGWFAAVDVHAEFTEAPLWSPAQETTVSFTLRPGGQPSTVISKVQQALAAGESVTLLPGEVQNIAFGGPGGLSGEAATGTVRITPWRLSPAPPQCRWEIADADGQLIAQAEIVFRPAVEDGDGGFRLEGSETSGVFSVDAAVVGHDGHFDMRLERIGVRDVGGRSAAEVADALNFLAALRAPHSLLVGFEEGNVLHEQPLQGTPSPIDPRFAAYVQDLAAIQQHVQEQILVPASVEAEQIEDAGQVRWVLSGKGLKIEGEDLVLRGSLSVPAAQRLAEATEPVPVTLRGPFLQLRVGTVDIGLPETQANIATGCLVGSPEFNEDGQAIASIKAADSAAVITYHGRRLSDDNCPR